MQFVENIVNGRLFFKVRQHVRDIPATRYLEVSPVSFCRAENRFCRAVSELIGDPDCRRANYFNYY